MRKWPSLIGERFGMLTVIGQAESSPSGQRKLVCKCDCGTQKVVLGSNLKRGTTVSCGCKRFNNLTGQHIGRLTVLERSDQFGSRGKRKVQLWKCLCDCGATTYKATDTLTNPDISMCQACAEKYAAMKAREKAGFTDRTQISKIKDRPQESANASGVRGVYFERRTGRFRARIKFQGTVHNLGSFVRLEDAVKARKKGEEKYFGTFLEAYEARGADTDGK